MAVSISFISNKLVINDILYYNYYNLYYNNYNKDYLIYTYIVI